MAKLEYTFKNDTLFKMLFVKYPELLKKLVSELLCIRIESIGQFMIMNPEIPPDSMGDKFCRLDINMTVDNQLVDLEIQINNRGDYPERSLYYWAREYSTALGEGEEYSDLPRTVIISIIDFNLFECEEFHSEYQALEVTRYAQLTDRMSLHYFELPKLPESIKAENGMELWLKLFKAETEEDLTKITLLEVQEMQQAIEAYRRITAASEFREMERLRSKARHDEAQALYHARLEAIHETDKKWQNVVTDKDALIADKDALIADRDVLIANKDALIAELRSMLNENK